VASTAHDSVKGSHLLKQGQETIRTQRAQPGACVERPIPPDRNEPSERQEGHHRQRTLRLAWVTILLGFLVNCTILLSVGYAVWSYRTYAMTLRTATLIVRTPMDLVTWQRKAHSIFEKANDGQSLEEGDRVAIASSAGYGQVATIRLFDQSTIDMWAKADLQLKTLKTSQWNNREQVVELFQRDGYIRYDLRGDQPYETNRFLVEVGGARVKFAPGGSYSIESRPIERRIVVSGETRFEPTIIDVAVRAGSATIYQDEREVTIVAGQRVLIDSMGTPVAPLPAVWELIRDGSFSQYTEKEYNNTTVTDQPTLPKAHTWQVYSGPAEAGASGFFRIAHGCAPQSYYTNDETCPPSEDNTAAWFFRQSGETTGFTTGVIQKLGPQNKGIDISEYRSLVFSAWVRILHQSVPLAGERGTECPIMVRFVVKEHQPTDPEQERVVCAYINHHPHDPTATLERAPGITYYEIAPHEWFHLQIELRDDEWLPEARYLRSIEVYANGHDYDSRATDISLIGSHYRPTN
jgi:hypothetical protein